MKIAIIGATGMAGSALVAESLKRGHSVTALARSAEKLAKLPANPNLTTKVQDAFALTPAESQRRRGYRCFRNRTRVWPFNTLTSQRV